MKHLEWAADRKLEVQVGGVPYRIAGRGAGPSKWFDAEPMDGPEADQPDRFIDLQRSESERTGQILAACEKAWQAWKSGHFFESATPSALELAPKPEPTPAAPKPKRTRVAAEFKVMRMRECPTPDECLDTPEKAVAYWREHITQAPWYDPDKEAAVVLILNARRRIIGHALVTLGLLDTCMMHAREVFRPAITVAGHAVILAHSHPSGDPTPTEADIKSTRDMIRAGQLLKIEVLDSLVIGTVTAQRPKGHASLRELGYFYS